MAKESHPESKEAMGKRLMLLRLAVSNFDNNQDAFAKNKLDISGARLNNWETGDNYIPMPIALELVRKFRVTLPWIYQGQEADLPADLLKKIEEARQLLKDGLITQKRAKK